jgi:hypothetical protein
MVDNGKKSNYCIYMKPARLVGFISGLLGVLCMAFLYTQRSYLGFIFPQPVFATNAVFKGTQFLDVANTAYFLDPNATGNSLIVAGTVGIVTTNPLTTLAVQGVGHFYPSGTTPDNTYNGSLRITQAAASGQYINLTRVGNYPWSIGTVYNTSNFAIGQGQTTDSSFTSPYFVIQNTTGYVGIGNTGPNQFLSIGAGTGSSTTIYNMIHMMNDGYDVPRAANTYSYGDKLVMWNDATGKSSIGIDTSYSMWFQSNGTANSSIQFFTGTGTTATEKARINSTGLKVTGNVVYTPVALTAGATVNIDLSKSNVFTLTPAQAETITLSPTTQYAGQSIRLIILTSGTNSYGLTFSATYFKPNGTLTTGAVTGKYFLLNFVSDGSYLIEQSRTAAL